MSAPRRALVTGGAGFIGSHLVEGLLARGWQVAALDDLSSGRRESVPSEADFREGTILSEADVSAAMRGAQVVFHLAASVSVPFSVENPVASFAVNSEGTLRILEEARKIGARVVYSSSSAAYGDRPETPKTEEVPPMPLSPYAAGKLAAEHLVSAYAHSFGMETVSLRYFNVFGPRQRPDSPYAAVVPIFISKLLRGEPLTVYGDGEQTRDFTYVSNVVEANLLAADAPGLHGQAVNIACGEEISLNELIVELASIIGMQPEVVFDAPRPGDVRFSVASNTLAESLLGYSPSVSWREGLRMTVEGFSIDG